MDKRWLGILIILVIGVSCMYLVADTSDTVGSAIAVVNKTTITIPHSFSKIDSDSDSILLANKNTNEKIYLKDLGKVDKANETFNRQLRSLSEDMVIINNSTKTINNVPVYTFYYQDGSEYNNSISYFYTCQHTFYMKMSGHENINDIDKNIEFILDTIQPDYKQTQ